MRAKHPDRRTYLTETPIPRLIWTLAVPTIISMLVTGIYNTADTYFVGRISTQATAAVGLVFSVMAIIQALGFFCGHGSGNCLSRMLGAGRQHDAEEMAATGFALALLLGVIVAAVGNLFAPAIADFLGATSASRADTTAYMRIILLGAPFTMGQFVINNQLRFQGSAMYAMVGLMLGAVMNIGLDPLLMFVFGLGVRGAAIATVMGQVTSFFALLAGSRRGENLRLRARNVRLTLPNLGQIVNGGMPSLARQGLAAISTLLLNRFARICGGDAAIAGMSIVTRILMLNVSLLIGFGQAYQPVCSYNYGAGRYTRVRAGFFYCLRYGTLMMTAAAVLCELFAPTVVGWFRDDPAVIAVGTTALRWQASVLPLLTFSILTNMMLQSMGRGVKASIASSARNGIFFIPLILILPHFFGLLGVEMTQAWADVLTFLMAVPLAFSELKQMKQDMIPATPEGGTP